MNKPLLGAVVGGILGIFDGLSAFVSSPEVAREQYLSIIIGSTFKGLIVGLVVAAFFAYLVAAMPQPDGSHYYWEIMIPGSIVGLIVGYATQTFGRNRPSRASAVRT